jgi:acetylornithine deacetylase/succinyl-diaminopimelate desuccinylase-like protein
VGKHGRGGGVQDGSGIRIAKMAPSNPREAIDSTRHLPGRRFYNRLPEDVKIVGTIRWDPGDKFEQVEERLRQRLRGLENKIRTEMDPEIEMRLEVDLHRNSSEIKNDDALVKAVQTATCEIIGHPLPLAGWRIVADQPFFVGNAGVPALYYGSFTDDDNTAHSNNESVSLDRLVTMAKVYVTSALFYCGYHT